MGNFQEYAKHGQPFVQLRGQGTFSHGVVEAIATTHPGYNLVQLRTQSHVQLMNISRRFLPAALAVFAVLALVLVTSRAFARVEQTVRLQVRDQQGRGVDGSQVRLYMYESDGKHQVLIKMDAEGNGIAHVSKASTRNCWQAITFYRGSAEQCYDVSDQPNELSFTLP
ncbi:MAG TPA: hypothetical protein VFO29_08590 [Candidatus Rubrimentiphilum sp.]|nr:hypothetical protein [Candidatus Rubrimentiphilum sp.]